MIWKFALFLLGALKNDLLTHFHFARGIKFHPVDLSTACLTGGGGVPRFELDMGVPLEPQNPYPSLRVILAEKEYPFLRIFLEK